MNTLRIILLLALADGALCFKPNNLPDQLIRKLTSDRQRKINHTHATTEDTASQTQSNTEASSTGSLVNLLKKLLEEERSLEQTNDNSIDAIPASSHLTLKSVVSELKSVAADTACDVNSKYRRMDGQCNNVQRKGWGAANEPYRRLVQPEYDNGVFTPRLKDKATGDMLPSPRAVSSIIHPGMSHLSRDDTVMVMQWGQFVDHDMTLTPTEDSDKNCCDGFVPGTPHADIASQGPCFPIGIPPQDHHFTKSCMEFRRSKPAKDSSPREQINKITGFLDASVVYGNNDQLIAELRHGAYMKTKGDNLLPESNKTKCRISGPNEWCFGAGDPRVNVFPGLSLLHTVFVREHNRLVDQLKTVLPSSTDEEVLFQEAKKIVSALIQQITYGEYLPLVLGPDAMTKYQLELSNKYKYDSAKDPTIYNVFATAALRFGHSAVPRFLRLGGRAVPIEEMFFRNTELIRDFEAVLESLLLDKQQQADRFVTRGMTDHLFETSQQNSFDIVSLNIQRGRDHGLPGYNAFREVFQLSRVTSFDDELFGSAGPLLRQVYNSPDEMDVFTGGLLEQPVRAGGVGPLFACLLAKQFNNVKYGDSFWYETEDKNRGFTRAQLDEIRKVTLSKVLCDNSFISQIQSNPFLLPNQVRNPVVQCTSLPRMDITNWRQ